MFWELVGLYTPTNGAKRDAARMERLIEIAETQPLFAYHALYTVDDYLKVSPDQLARKLTLENRLTAFRPYPEVMLKRAQLEILAGQQSQAEQTLRMTLASFPTYAGVFWAHWTMIMPNGNPCGKWRVTLMPSCRLNTRPSPSNLAARQRKTTGKPVVFVISRR